MRAIGFVLLGAAPVGAGWAFLSRGMFAGSFLQAFVGSFLIYAGYRVAEIGEHERKKLSVLSAGRSTAVLAGLAVMSSGFVAGAQLASEGRSTLLFLSGSAAVLGYNLAHYFDRGAFF